MNIQVLACMYNAQKYEFACVCSHTSQEQVAVRSCVTGVIFNVLSETYITHVLHMSRI